MSLVRIESFVSPTENVQSLMSFKEMYVRNGESQSEDFPDRLDMYHWIIAYVGWTVFRNTPPAPVQSSPQAWQGARVGVPNEHKPLCDLHAGRGFFVMVGTVALVLDLSGFDQAAVEFLSYAHHVDYDTGQLYMLAFDYVHSITTLDIPKEGAD
jgi:hypothetical protein